MRETCHRCGGDLFAGDSPAIEGHASFCPHCGTPQLFLSDYAEPLSTGTEEVAVPASTGTLPPPRPNHIEWRVAILSASAVAAVAAALSLVAARVPNTSLLSTVWIISASLTTLALYQRRRPLATMNAGVGARIGILVGVVLVFFLGATFAVGMVVARYGLHSLTQFDDDFAQALKMQIDQLSATKPVPPESLALMNSLEFRTAIMLSGFGILLFGVLLISIFGGALGGLLRTRRFSSKA